MAQIKELKLVHFSNLAMCHMKLGNVQKARDNSSKAHLRIDPNPNPNPNPNPDPDPDPNPHQARRVEEEAQAKVQAKLDAEAKVVEEQRRMQAHVT